MVTVPIKIMTHSMDDSVENHSSLLQPNKKTILMTLLIFADNITEERSF